MPPTAAIDHRLRITPHGRLVYEPYAVMDDAAAGPPPAIALDIAAAFAAGQTCGLLHLSGVADASSLPSDLVFYRVYARRFSAR